MKSISRLFACTLIAVFVGMFFCVQVNAADITMKIGLAVSEKSLDTVACQKFKELAEKRTNGKVEIQIFPGGQLGGEVEMIEKLQTGVIQGSYISVAAVSNVSPKCRFAFLPYLFPSWEAANDFLKNSEYRKIIFGELEQKNLLMLEPIILGEYNISTSRKPFLTLEDISNVKIRSKETPVSIDGLKAIGMAPMPVAFPDLYQALQRGTLDAISMPLQYTLTSKFYEVVKFVALAEIEFLFSGLEVSKKWWEGLPGDVRSVLRAALTEAFDWQRERQKEYYNECMRGLMNEGVYIRNLTKAEKRKFHEMTRNVREKYAADLGLKSFLDEIETANKGKW